MTFVKARKAPNNAPGIPGEKPLPKQNPFRDHLSVRNIKTAEMHFP